MRPVLRLHQGIPNPEALYPFASVVDRELTGENLAEQRYRVLMPSRLFARFEFNHVDGHVWGAIRINQSPPQYVGPSV